MAVFDRQYQPWEGVRTGTLERLLILPRYAYRDVFASRLFTGLFAGSFVAPLIAALLIWVRNSAPLLAKLNSSPDQMPGVDGRVFLVVMYAQLWFAAILTLIHGPALVSPDLVNGALPLYLSRPVTKTQYVLGKFLVLALLLSAITWVPLALLFLLQGSLSAEPWMIANLRLLGGSVAGSAVAIAVFSILALALSAWVKAKALARALVAGLLIIPSAFGQVINGTLHTYWGSTLNLVAVLEAVAAHLLGVPTRVDLPLGPALASLAVIGVASLLLLNRRLRAFEVVR